MDHGRGSIEMTRWDCITEGCDTTVLVGPTSEMGDVDEVNYKCKICGSIEAEDTARDHLESHNPNARGFSTEEVFASYEIED